MVKYSKIGNPVSIENETQVTYGIEAKKDGVTLISIPDISDNESALDKLISACNELNLEPEHLSNVIEDFFVND